jgi:type IV secretory pathway TraG/TraD family ATPase VirD4
VSTVTGRRAGGGELAAAWVIPVLAALAAITTAALWAGAGLVSLATGRAWPAVPLSASLLVDLARAGGPTGLWPALDPAAVVAAAVVLAALVLAPAALLGRWLWRRRPAGATRSLASRGDVAPMLAGPAAAKARALRPSLAPRGKLGAHDTGLALGRLLPRGPVLTASWEDVALAVMAPRSGKTTALAVPATLAAPGPVVLTSNKSDAWAATAALRAADTGQRVWTFDPQQIARAQQLWYWDPLADLAGVEDAERLASHFVLTVDDEHTRDIWGPAAAELLAALFLAGHLAGADLTTAYAWLQSELDPTAVATLDQAGYPALARSLRASMEAPAETRGSVLFTARTAVRCLRDPQITAWTTPRPELDRFDPAAFVCSRQTLYLLSKDGGGSAAPLVAALTDRVLRCAVNAAEDRGGRLDPPLLAVLDEAANVCRIADLPQLYSHLGSRGILPLTILQSYAQGEAVWGRTGMRTLWSAATVKLLGAGLDEAGFVEDVSRLVGEHDVPADSWSHGDDGRSTRTSSTRRERILPAAELRALPKGSALLLATGTRPALLSLLPWYDGPRAAAVASEVQTATAGISRRGATAGVR